MTAAPGPSPVPPRVLVVDDDEGLLLLMAEALRCEGCDVGTARSGSEALSQLVTDSPDLLVLDLKLADVDALGLVRRLGEGNSRVPFVVVTGQGDERVAVDVMKRGALDYVMKDSAMLDLLPSVVRRALDAVARERALAAARTEQARLEREVLAASERERHSIGADLHDGLGQILTAVEFMCTALKEETATTQPETAARLDQMGGMLREAVAQTRFLARGLVPLGGGPDALRHGLRSLAERTHALGRVSCGFSAAGAVDVAGETASTHLYRIAQEAVSNAVRHSGADTIHVSLVRRASRLVLGVADNGAGLPSGSGAKGTGLGLMHYRAGLIGAVLDVRSRRGRGVAVTCRWPLPA